MQIFNADNLSFIMLGFAKTLEISFFAIIFSIILGTVLAMINSTAGASFARFRFW